MVAMIRNKSTFYYALYESKIQKIDEYGNINGEYEIIWSNPVKYEANISSAKGEISTRQFGENEAYDKTIVMDDVNTSIDEYTILWVDIIPQLNEDGTLTIDDEGNIITPHDYIVKKIAKSLNSVSIAISKVNVSG